MAIIDDSTAATDTLLRVAKAMVVAAITAPKGKGVNNIETCIVTNSDIAPIVAKMQHMAVEFDVPSFARDAANISQCDVMVLFGTKITPLFLKKCGMCGFANCEEKLPHSKIPCVFNSGDLGIALGSAVSVAMDNKIDNRIMYTVGQAVREMDIFSRDVQIVYAIPLHVSKKNIFFDR